MRKTDLIESVPPVQGGGPTAKAAQVIAMPIARQLLRDEPILHLSYQAGMGPAARF